MAELNIHSLMKEFSKLEGAEIGRGPKHPSSPDPNLAQETEAFLNEYPFLRQDQGYVDFLESYAGAWVMWPNNELIIDLFGFTEVSRNIANPDNVCVVDENGFLIVYDGMVRLVDGGFREGVIGQGFAFDATGERKWGIYRYVFVSGVEVARYWYCETFLQALAALIETRGKLPAILS